MVQLQKPVQCTNLARVISLLDTVVIPGKQADILHWKLYAPATPPDWMPLEGMAK